LAPVPKRGKPNEPAFLLHTATFVAELRGQSLDQVAAETTQNALRLFGKQLVVA
jgi:TatD DNase family protein